MAIHEPRELIPVHTPLGFGHVMFVEFGEFDTHWTVVLETQAIVTFPQEKIRVSRSYSHGRNLSDREMRKLVKKR
jgi:hypothetical protein